jgi:hypothetical protein
LTVGASERDLLHWHRAHQSNKHKLCSTPFQHSLSAPQRGKKKKEKEEKKGLKTKMATKEERTTSRTRQRTYNRTVATVIHCEIERRQIEARS